MAAVAAVAAVGRMLRMVAAAVHCRRRTAAGQRARPPCSCLARPDRGCAPPSAACRWPSASCRFPGTSRPPSAASAGSGGPETAPGSSSARARGSCRCRSFSSILRSCARSPSHSSRCSRSCRSRVANPSASFRTPGPPCHRCAAPST
uniref:Putative secreted protein n=1 Tax=Anopheles triannulatus TaxID=58253 RepID=A0A2M4B4M0_9DIPT